MKKIIIAGMIVLSVLSPVYSETKAEKIFTINTDPILPFIYGLFYLTLDIKILDHFILGNAVFIRNGNISVISKLRLDIITMGYTLGLAYFPFEPKAKGFHLAAFTSPTIKFEADHTGFDLLVGSYLGYSFHILDTIKLSLKLGGIYTDITNIKDSLLLPHISFEIGYMF